MIIDDMNMSTIMEQEIDEEDPLFRFIDKDLKHVRCDYEGCDSLTHMLFKLQDMPKKLSSKVIPSYDVFVKLCPEHVEKIGLKNLGEPHLFDFMYTTEQHESGYFCVCMRCEHTFVPQTFIPALYYAFKDNYGRLVVRCPNCNQKNWKLPRYRPTPKKAFVKGESAIAGKRVVINKKTYKRAIKERNDKNEKGGEL